MRQNTKWIERIFFHKSSIKTIFMYFHTQNKKKKKGNEKKNKTLGCTVVSSRVSITVPILSCQKAALFYSFFSLCVWHILAFYKKGIKGKQLWLALEKLFSLHIVELSSLASYCHFITLQHIGSKTRTATSCLQWAGAVTELSGLLSVSMWLEIKLKTVGCYQQVNFFFFFFLIISFLAFTCNVKASKAKIFNPEEQVSFLILSNILEYTWNNRLKYACNSIVSEVISKVKPWRQKKKKNN